MYCIGCILDFHIEQYDYLIYIEGKCVCNMDLEKKIKWLRKVLARMKELLSLKFICLQRDKSLARVEKSRIV